MIPTSDYLVVGAILFVLGAIGFLTRRNLILMFLSAELMLQGVSLNFVAFSRQHGNLNGQVFTLFVITVAACEAALALALILMLYHRRASLDVSLWQDLRESGQESTLDLDAPEPGLHSAEPTLPTLTPAGVEPAHRNEDSYV
jgi:NADH-quinone oxidoreductase subunit K